MRILLHVGAANKYYEGFINSDSRFEWKGKKHKLDMIMPLEKLWPFENESVDGVIGMHVFQQLYWRDLLMAFEECYRVLKPGGVLRMGVPSVEIKDKSLHYFLGWNNINLFSYDLLENILKRFKFSSVRRAEYQDSVLEEFRQVDNRPETTIYIEAVK